MQFKTLMMLSMILAMTVGSVSAQLTPWHPWTFLPENQIDEMIGEVSGELALSHIIEMAGYNRNRPESEYAGMFWEAEYVLTKMKEYGLSGAKIDRFPGRKTWDVIKGELWEVSPRRQKLVDYDEVPPALVGNSENADVTAELVWVGEGKLRDFEGIDVAGKIVATYSSPRGVFHVADSLGAVGIISFYSPRPTFDPTQIPWSRIRPGDHAKFAFFMAPREGYLLKDRLVRGEKIKVHAKVKTQMLSYEIQDPTCYIPGTEPNGDEIILSAHLFEGYAKQGANDNISGSAVILEIARALHTLIEEGRLTRPRRTIRFLWVPEFSGSRPWVEANPDIMQRTLCNINMDMVGARLSKNFSFYSVMRTTFGNPHYINDVMENYLRFVGRTNREILQNRRFAKFIKPIIAPTGSIEPFYYSIETHYGSSDHEVFNALNVRVPGVLMITWPDQWYHTSGDRPDKVDPTQLKRAAFISLAAAYTIASADDAMAMAIAGEVTSNGSGRIGHQLALGLEKLNRVESQNLADLYKTVRGCIEAAAMNEKATIATTLELAMDTKTVASYIKEMQRAIDEVKNGNLRAIDRHMLVTAKRLNAQPAKLTLTNLEKQAVKLIPKPKDKLQEFSVQMVREKLGAERAKYSPRWGSTGEINLLIDGRHNVLDIKKMLDVEYQRPADLQGVLNHLENLKLLGMVDM
ncbi:MAG: DUF4910 domain-containing protein [bacterium]